MALASCRANAIVNGCELTLLENIEALDTHIDLILAADVLYDRENVPWLEQLATITPNILLADSRMKTSSTGVTGYSVSTPLPSLTLMRPGIHGR